MKNRLYQGDTVEYGVNVPDFLPADGWSLKLYLKQRSVAGAALSYTATPNLTIDGTLYDYGFQIGISTTATWAAGQYGWVHKVEKAGAAHTLEGTQHQGEVVVLADIASGSSALDTRSQAQKAVDDLKAALATYTQTGTAGSLANAVRAHAIGDRRVEYRDPGEMAAGALQLLSFWQQQLAREQLKERMASGLPDPRRTYVRFGNV